MMSKRFEAWFVPVALVAACSACRPSAPSAQVTMPRAAATGSAEPDASAPNGGRATARTSAETPERRAAELLAQMTLEEKIDYLGGDREFYIRAVVRLGIPEIKMSDGPAGCRNWGPSTAYPAPLTMAAAFDVDLAERVGRSFGRDCRARGVHVLLGPGVNIHRSPLAGRNFEYFGEDPFLAGKVAAAFTRGVQSEGVLATVKHFAANNQEWDRNGVSSEVDERTLREIYLPAFERSVREGGVAAVMTAYNRLNGTFCSENPWLIRQVLKKEWGFGGMVMSDWGAVHDALGAANGGCDLEMPSGKQMNRANLLPLIAAHKVDIAAIDDKVLRILRTIVAAGFLDRPQKRDIPLDDPSSSATALDSARRGIVLLKNDGILPLDLQKTKHIAVLGPNAMPAVVGGSGSAFVTPFRAISLLDGIRREAEGIAVDYHPGVRQTAGLGLIAVGGACFAGPVEQSTFEGTELAGSPMARGTVDRIDFRLEAQASSASTPAATDSFSIRWTGEIVVLKAGSYRFMTNSDDGVRVFLDKEKIIDDWADHGPTADMVTVSVAVGRHAVVVEYYQRAGGAIAQFGFGPEPAATAAYEGGGEVTALARKADVVIVSVGFGQTADTNGIRTSFDGHWPPPWVRKRGIVETEDSDRTFALPAEQVETIRLAVAANPRTVVVVNAGGAVDLQPFVDRVPALVWAWYPGQEGGRAVADVLFGRVNPSGKLPVTFAKRYDNYPSAPYYNVSRNGKTPYSEGVFVGYRGFEERKVSPQFPFGHGLSYTRFRYDDLDVAPGADGDVTVALNITNVGERAGDEIVEVYVAPPTSSVARPPKELKGFARVSLQQGETTRVSVALEPRSFAYWDDARKHWSVDDGSFQLLVGASSTDIRLRGKADLSARAFPP